MYCWIYIKVLKNTYLLFKIKGFKYGWLCIKVCFMLVNGNLEYSFLWK